VAICPSFLDDGPGVIQQRRGAMEERVERQVLVDVDLQAPPRVHRDFGRAPCRRRIDPGRVGLESVAAIAVADDLGGAHAERGEVGVPGSDEGEPKVDRLGPSTTVGTLAGLLAIATDAVRVAALAELGGTLAGRRTDGLVALLAWPSYTSFFLSGIM